MPVMRRTAERIRPAEIDAAYAAAQCVVETHRRVAAFLRAGLTMAELDRFVAQTLEELRCRSCFLGYKVPRTPAFPSHACLSVNDCIVHGTASSHARPLKPGDVVKVDIGVLHKGWIGDAAWTYSIGEPTPEIRRLMDCGKESIRRGVATLTPRNLYLEWARVVQDYVEGQCGLHLVRGLGGHGYGRKLHAPPFIANVVPSYPGDWPDAMRHCEPGTLIAVEPMIAMGTGQTRQARGEWPIYTADGSTAVHYEHDLLITGDGPRVLTEGLEDVPDVIIR
jgi:methionyl aminopeptidase